MAFLLTGVNCGTTVTLAAGNLWFVSKLQLRNCNQSCPFQASVMRGSIPAELVKEAKGGEVHVDMEDHR